jgi:hypothetical protein
LALRLMPNPTAALDLGERPKEKGALRLLFDHFQVSFRR